MSLNKPVFKFFIGAFFFLFLHTAIAGDVSSFLNQPSRLFFLENKGQITDQHSNPRTDIQYKLEAQGLTVFIGSGGLHYQWIKSESSTSKERKGRDTLAHRAVYRRLDVTLVGANKNCKGVPEGKLNYREQYYLSQCPDGAVANAVTKITFPEVYPHIDWVLYVKDGQLKYDFVVKPGGNPDQIQLKYEGADNLYIQNGRLEATTNMGSIMEEKPYSYEQHSGREVASSYMLKDNVLSFDVQHYEGTLVIDPILEWATYYGGSGDDNCWAVVTDKWGNAYIAGETNSANNIATAGSFQDTLVPFTNGFLAKFDVTGNRIWGTYFSAPIYDMVYNGNYLYLCGHAWGGGYLGTPGTHMPVGTGNNDVLLKFDTSGNRIWGTFYGSGSWIWNSLAADGNGNVYMAGITNGTQGITTPGCHQSLLAGMDDTYLAKFDSSGQLLWGTYYGGSNTEMAYSIWSRVVDVACDKNGNVYLCGNTKSLNNISTPGTHQPVYTPNSVSSSGDGFLAKFDAFGNRQWGTYYGGNDNELVSSIICDAEGFVYISGYTESLNGIATAGSLQDTLVNTNGNGYDAFLAKFNPGGSIEWATYYGGEGMDQFSSLYIDNTGDIITGGYTTSLNGVTTPGSLPASDYNRGLFVKFDKNGNRKMGSYFGGIYMDVIWDITADIFNNIYISGPTGSFTGLATPGAFQTVYGGHINNSLYGDGFLAKVSDPDTGVFIKSSLTATVLCAGTNTFNVAYGILGTFATGNFFTVQLSDATGSFANPVNIGSVAATASGTINATLPPGLAAGADYKIRIVATSPADTSSAHPVNIYPSNTAPAITTTVQADSICLGDTATFLAIPSAAGPNPTFEWMVNGSVVPNAVGAFYITDSLQQGDIVSCIYRSNLPCVAGNDSAHSNNVIMTVFNIDSPAVSIFHLPAVSIVPKNTAITYYSTVINGGTNPTYQWKKNGIDISNATADTLVLVSGTDFGNGDSISLEITSNRPCVTKDSAESNKISVQVSLSVINAPVLAGIMKIYPNPSDGHFIVSGYCPKDIKDISVNAYNSLGQKVFRDNIKVDNGSILKELNLSHLPDGIYWLYIDEISQKLIIKH